MARLTGMHKREICAQPRMQRSLNVVPCRAIVGSGDAAHATAPGPAIVWIDRATK